MRCRAVGLRYAITLKLLGPTSGLIPLYSVEAGPTLVKILGLSGASPHQSGSLAIFLRLRGRSPWPGIFDGPFLGLDLRHAGSVFELQDLIAQ